MCTIEYPALSALHLTQSAFLDYAQRKISVMGSHGLGLGALSVLRHLSCC